MLRQTPEQAAAVAKRVYEEALARDAETNAILAKARGGMSSQQIAQLQSEVSPGGNLFTSNQLQPTGAGISQFLSNPAQFFQQQQQQVQVQPQANQGQFPFSYGNQGMFGGTASSRNPYTSYQQYQPYSGQNYSSGMFGSPVSNSNWQAGNIQQQNTGWSQNNPYSMKRW